MNLAYLQRLGSLSQPEADLAPLGKGIKQHVLTSMEPGREYTLMQIVLDFDVNKDSARRVIRELINSGHITRRKDRIGKFSIGWYYKKSEK